MPLLFRITIHIAHIKEKIKFGELKEEKYEWNSMCDKKMNHIIAVASTVFTLKKSIRKIKNLKRRMGFFKKYSQNFKRLVILSSLIYLACKEVIKNADLMQSIDKIIGNYYIIIL